jgi:hypothetical protein
MAIEGIKVKILLKIYLLIMIIYRLTILELKDVAILYYYVNVYF